MMTMFMPMTMLMQMGVRMLAMLVMLVIPVCR